MIEREREREKNPSLLRAREKRELQRKKTHPSFLSNSTLHNHQQNQTNKHENQVSSKIGTAGDPLDPSYDGGVAELVERAAELSFPASVGAFFSFLGLPLLFFFFFFQACGEKKRKKLYFSPSSSLFFSSSPSSSSPTKFQK